MGSGSGCEALPVCEVDAVCADFAVVDDALGRVVWPCVGRVVELAGALLVVSAGVVGIAIAGGSGSSGTGEESAVGGGASVDTALLLDALYQRTLANAAVTTMIARRPDQSKKLAADMSFFFGSFGACAVLVDCDDVAQVLFGPVTDGPLGAGAGAAVISAGPRIAMRSSEGAAFGPA